MSENKTLNPSDVMRVASELADIVSQTPNLCDKEMLTAKETAQYMGITLSGLYQLTCKRELPHYKPKGKMVYFKRSEIDGFLMQNRVASNAELSDMAMKYCHTTKQQEQRRATR